ncbi:MAG: hypothetical protein AAF726_18995 [Planctomycetota bacterium]
MRSVPAPSGPTWANATSFEDLLALGRRFLLGEIERFPGWGGRGLDDESEPLLEALLGVNARGMLTVASQPGLPFEPGHDGREWAGRAFIGGFASERAAAELAAASTPAGLMVLVEDGTDDGPALDLPVGLRDGTPYLVLSSGARAKELEIFRDEASPGTERVLAPLPFLWVVDPVWGRRDRLTPTLAATRP